MASLQPQSSSHEPHATRAVPTRSVSYARSHLVTGRAELASTTSSRGSRTPGVTRLSRAAQLAKEPVVLSSSFTGGSNMRAMRHSNYGAGEYVPSSSNGRGSTHVESPEPRLARHYSVHSQPLPKTPGTPGKTRARMVIGSNGALRPMANPSSLLHTRGSAVSLTTSPTRGRYSLAAAAAAAAAALPADDVLCKILGSCLPTVFEALAKYQYQQATNALSVFAEELESDESDVRDVRLEWKSWNVFTVMVRLAASCESSYHLMRYLEPDMLHKETLDQLYSKLVVLLNHLVDDIQPVLKRAQQRSSRNERKSTPLSSGSTSSASGDVRSVTSAEALQAELERLTVDDLEYYHGLLQQAAEFFALRISMVELYRGLATQPPPQKYAGMAKTLDRMMKRYAQFEHPLLHILKQSAIEELRTVKAAFESEICMSQYDFTKSMVALHRFKVSLRLWSDHIDSVSEYPLFDESDDEDDYMMSSSTYSNSNSHSSNTLLMQQQPVDGGGVYTGSDAPLLPVGSLPRPQRESSFRRTSFTSARASTTEMAAFAAASEQAVAAAAAASSTPPEIKSTFSRLMAQRGALLKRGLSVTSLRSKLQSASASQPPTSPTNALEHAILGSTPSVVNGIGAANSMLTPVGNGLSSVGTGGGASGFNTTNSHTLAAEMMASAVAKQEREDGYALPVYQWSKRFYRSLVAKFTLYFHRWLEPFEKRGDALSPFDLTRFIRSPVGISYLQLIDVLLAKGSHRVEDGTASVMLILETDKLDNKGAKFYSNGYFCPEFSRKGTVTSEVMAPKKMGYAAKAAAAAAGRASSNRTAPSSMTTTATISTSSNGSSSQKHSLFNLNFDPEAEDEDNGDFAPLWGLRGWPAVFCYPQQDAPLEHWPNIVSLIMDNRHVLEAQTGRGPFVHTERRLKTSYYVMSVDPAVYLVLLVEGKRRPSEKTTQDFMQTMAENLQHSGVYRRGGVASSGKS